MSLPHLWPPVPWSLLVHSSLLSLYPAFCLIKPLALPPSSLLGVDLVFYTVTIKATGEIVDSLVMSAYSDFSPGICEPDPHPSPFETFGSRNFSLFLCCNITVSSLHGLSHQYTNITQFRLEVLLSLPPLTHPVIFPCLSSFLKEAYIVTVSFFSTSPIQFFWTYYTQAFVDASLPNLPLSWSPMASIWLNLSVSFQASSYLIL